MNNGSAYLTGRTEIFFLWMNAVYKLENIIWIVNKIIKSK